MINFNEIDVTVNGTGILAENASVSANNNLAPIYALGKKNITPQAITGPFQGNMQFDYIMDLGVEPNQPITTTLKTTFPTFHHEPSRITIAGLTGFSYLDSYSINISPNNPGKSVASYLVFTPFSGALAPKKGNFPYNTSGIRALSHGWSTRVTTPEETFTFPTFEFNYNFKANWQPVYVIGKTIPTQVHLMSIEENISISKDFYKNILIEGQEGWQFLNFSSPTANISIIALFGELLAGGPAILNININGMKVRSSKLSAGLNDVVKNTVEMRRNY